MRPGSKSPPPLDLWFILGHKMTASRIFLLLVPRSCDVARRRANPKSPRGTEPNKSIQCYSTYLHDMTYPCLDRDAVWLAYLVLCTRHLALVADQFLLDLFVHH